MSHYIPVGKLKIDKDLLDIACPAAGYGSIPPPASIYCPAAGYVLKYPEYVPPAGMILPESVPQSIIFICNSNFGIWSYTTFAKAGTSSSYVYEIFDLAGNFINTITTSSSAAQTFSFPEPKGYYVVRVTLTNPGGYFTTMGSGLSADYFLIEKIIFNTPNFTSMQNSCKYMAGLRAVEFNCTLDLLTSFTYAFQYSGLYQFKFLDSYPALTSMLAMFQGASEISQIDFPSYCSLPLLTTIATFARDSNAKTILFPDSLPELTTATDMCRGAKNLSEVRHFLSAPKLTIANYAFSGTAIVGEATLPVYKAMTSATYFFSDNLPLTKINFTGDALVACNYNSFLANNKKVQEIIYPSVFATTVSTYLASNSLKKVKLPDTLLAGSITNITGYLHTGSPNLEEVTGDYDNSAIGSAGALTITSQPLALKIWNTPKLRCDSICIGSTGAAYFYSVLEVFEVDWINSPWAPSPTRAIQFYANVNAAWINALFGKLPVVTGGQKIDMINCTGYATCDPSIATAKGWTVL